MSNTKPNHSRLEPWEINAVIDWLLYRLNCEHRRQLMQELPLTYNKLIGREIMAVVNTTDAAYAAARLRV